MAFRFRPFLLVAAPGLFLIYAVVIVDAIDADFLILC
jgi:hypothetical protein